MILVRLRGLEVSKGGTTGRKSTADGGNLTTTAANGQEFCRCCVLRLLAIDIQW